MLNKSLFGGEFVSGTKFELKVRLMRAKNYKFVMGVIDPFALVQKNSRFSIKQTMEVLQTLGITNNLVHFLLWKQSRPSKLAALYASTHKPLVFFKVVTFYVGYNLLKLVDAVLYTALVLLKVNFTTRTHIQTIASRDFLFEILKQAEEEGRKIVYLDVNPSAGKIVQDLITRLFPTLDFESYIHEPRSLVTVQTSDDFFVNNPHWYEAKQFLAKSKRDIVLFAARGLLEDELECIRHFKKDQTLHFGSLLLADVSELETKTKRNALQLDMVSKIALEQFMYALDAKKSWRYLLHFAVHMKKGLVVTADGTVPVFVSSNLDNLEMQVLRVVSDLVRSVSDIKVTGSIKQSRRARITPSLEQFRDMGYSYSKDVDVTIPFAYQGEESDLAPGLSVKPI